MTFVWAFLWLMLAVGILGILGWSLNILLAQKKAWSAFGEKYKLKIRTEPGFFKPISVDGSIGGRRVNIYSRTERNLRERLQRIYTHIEVYLNTVPPAMALFSKHALPEALADMTLPEIFAVASPEWPVMKVAQTSDAAALAAWMTPERVKALNSFMAMAAKDTETIVICDGTQAFLLWRSENPLRDPKTLNAQVQKLFAAAKALDAESRPAQGA